MAYPMMTNNPYSTLVYTPGQAEYLSPGGSRRSPRSKEALPVKSIQDVVDGLFVVGRFIYGKGQGCTCNYLVLFEHLKSSGFFTGKEKNREPGSTTPQPSFDTNNADLPPIARLMMNDRTPKTPTKSAQGQTEELIDDLELRRTLRKGANQRMLEFTEESNDFVITLCPEMYRPAGYQYGSPALRTEQKVRGTVKSEDLDAIVSVEVVESTQRHVQMTSHAVYVVKVVLGSKDSYEVGKQYSEFLEFHTAISAEFRTEEFVSFVNTLHMPGKFASFTKKTDKLVLDRLNKFDVYLKALLAKCKEKSTDRSFEDKLKEFLNLGEWAADFRRMHRSWNKKLERDQMKEQLDGLHLKAIESGWRSLSPYRKYKGVGVV
jgi:hypothetical protein